MSKDTSEQKLNVVYEFVPSDPAHEKDGKQELERGFDVLFDIVLKELEADLLMGCKIARHEGVLTAQKST